MSVTELGVASVLIRRRGSESLTRGLARISFPDWVFLTIERPDFSVRWSTISSLVGGPVSYREASEIVTDDSKRNSGSRLQERIGTADSTNVLKIVASSLQCTMMSPAYFQRRIRVDGDPRPAYMALPEASGETAHLPLSRWSVLRIQFPRLDFVMEKHECLIMQRRQRRLMPTHPTEDLRGSIRDRMRRRQGPTFVWRTETGGSLVCLSSRSASRRPSGSMLGCVGRMTTWWQQR